MRRLDQGDWWGYYQEVCQAGGGAQSAGDLEELYTRAAGYTQVSSCSRLFKLSQLFCVFKLVPNFLKILSFNFLVYS